MLCLALPISARISLRDRSGPTINRRPSGRRDGSGTPAASALKSVSSPLTTDGILGDQHRVPGAGEAFPRRIERRDDRGRVVGDQVLGVVLDDRIGVARDDGAHFFERAPQLLQPLLAALGALGEHRLDFAAAFERGRQRIEHRKVVAAEQRQDQSPLRGADHTEQRRLPFGGIEDEPFLDFGRASPARFSLSWAATRRHS